MRPKPETDHSPPSNAEVKNGGAIPPLPHTSVWCGGYVINHRGKFTFTLVLLTYGKNYTVGSSVYTVLIGRMISESGTN
jgi:hypothetical protein